MIEDDQPMPVAAKSDDQPNMKAHQNPVEVSEILAAELILSSIVRVRETNKAHIILIQSLWS